MDDNWRTVEVYAPPDLTIIEAYRHIHSTIRLIACESGEFVDAVRFGDPIRQPDGWSKWSARYVPCPPGVFRQRSIHPTAAVEDEPQGDENANAPRFQGD